MKHLPNMPKFAILILLTIIHFSYSSVTPGSRQYFGFATGLWVPTGNAKLLGSHPVINFSMGGKVDRYEFRGEMEGRLLNSPNSYQISKDGSIYTTNEYTGFFAGLIGEFTLLDLNRQDFRILTGVGIDNFSSLKVNNDKIIIQAGTIVIGLSHLFILSSLFQLRNTIRFNFVSYNNPQGTPLNGNSITFLIGLDAGRYNKPKH